MNQTTIGNGSNTLDDLSRLGQVPSKPESESGLYDDNYIPSLYAEDIQTGISCDMLCVFETAFAREVSEREDAKARVAAVEILRNLFVSRRKDIGDAAIQTVAVIPDIPELGRFVGFMFKQPSPSRWTLPFPYLAAC